MDSKELINLFEILYTNGKNVLNQVNNPKKIAQQYLIDQIEKNNFNDDTLKNACMIMNVKKF